MQFRILRLNQLWFTPMSATKWNKYYSFDPYAGKNTSVTQDCRLFMIQFLFRKRIRPVPESRIMLAEFTLSQLFITLRDLKWLKCSVLKFSTVIKTCWKNYIQLLKISKEQHGSRTIVFFFCFCGGVSFSLLRFVVLVDGVGWGVVRGRWLK